MTTCAQRLDWRCAVRAPKSLKLLPTTSHKAKPLHLNQSPTPQVRHLEGKEVEEEALQQVSEELMGGAVSVLLAAGALCVCVCVC